MTLFLCKHMIFMPLQYKSVEHLLHTEYWTKCLVQKRNMTKFVPIPRLYYHVSWGEAGNNEFKNHSNSLRYKRIQNSTVEGTAGTVGDWNKKWPKNVLSSSPRSLPMLLSCGHTSLSLPPLPSSIKPTPRLPRFALLSSDLSQLPQNGTFSLQTPTWWPSISV